MKSFASFIDTAQKVALVVGNVDSLDKAYTIIALNRLFFKRKIEVTNVFVKIKEDLAASLKASGVNFKQSLSAPKYIVSIDYGSTGIEKISHDIDEKSGKVYFNIIPKHGDFNFDQVEYKVEGDRFDKVIVMGVDKLDQLEESYTGNESLFDLKKILNVTPNNILGAENSVEFKDGQSYSSAMASYIDDFAPDDVMEILQQGMVVDIALIEGENRQSALEDLKTVLNSGANITELIRNKYYTKSYENFALQMRLIHNMVFDRGSKRVWSIVDNSEIKASEVEASNVDLTGRILFNITNEFDFAWTALELEPGTYTVIVESNDLEKASASVIAESFGGSGNDYHAQFTVPAESKDAVVTAFNDRVATLYNTVSTESIQAKSSETTSAEQQE